MSRAGVVAALLISCAAAAKTPGEVLASFRAECSHGEFVDLTPSALSRLGWRLWECMPNRLEESGGWVSIYRLDAGQLSLARELTPVGGGAKFFSEGTFELIGWRMISTGGRKALQLTWSRQEGERDRWASTRVTFCRQQQGEPACPVDVVTACTTFVHADPDKLSSPVVQVSVAYDFRVRGGQVVVEPRAGAPADSGPPCFGAAGIFPLW